MLSTSVKKLPVWRGKEYKEAILILGRGSGKTTLTAAIAAYEACCTDWHRFVRKGEFAWIFVIATREQQAQDLGRNMIFSNIKGSPYLRDLVLDPDQMENVQLPRSKSGVLLLKTGAAIAALPCSSKVGRGYGAAVAILDEAAFFARYSTDTKGTNSDQEIYDAILPRQLQFGDMGKIIIITTPADKTGLVWERWRDRGRKQNKGLYYIQRTPTWKIRTDYDPEYYEDLRKRSPLGYNREMGAQFTDSLSPLLKERDVIKCMREDDAPIPYDPNKVYVMAIDAAFGERDRFSLAVGHLEEKGDSFKIIIDIAEIIEATFDTDVHDRAVERIVEVYNEYDGFDVIADQYQGDAFSKTLEDRGVNIEQQPWTAASHRSGYGKLRACIKRELIEMPNNKDLLDELTGISVKFLPSGQYTIVHKTGGHDDVADSVVRVVEQLYEEDTGSIGIEFF